MIGGVRAIHFTNAEQYERTRTPGSFMLIERGEAGHFELDYFCPCGCGVQGSLLIGEGFKPEKGRPSWKWNGSRSEPTLDPSVNHKGHWHGWLRTGYWQVC